MAKVVGVISGKGGVGKTTTVVNVGTALSLLYNKNVMVIDCNVTTSHLGLHLGMYYNPVTLDQVLKRGILKTKMVDMPEMITEAIHIHESGMRVIPASLSLESLDAYIDNLKHIIHIVKKFMSNTDIILLDSAPGYGKEAIATMEASDELLCVTNPYLPSITDVMNAYRLGKKMDKKMLGTVLNRVMGGRHELNIKEIENLTNLPIVSVVPEDKNVLKSLAAKTPVINFKPNSHSSREFIRLAGFLINEEYKAPRRGFFGRALTKLFGYLS